MTGLRHWTIRDLCQQCQDYSYRIYQATIQGHDGIINMDPDYGAVMMQLYR